MSNGSEHREGESVGLGPEYAWNWFQYHAAQRLTAFNFFLILVGFLFVAYAQAVDHQWVAVGFAVGALGALVAVGFWVLDVRNEELVLVGHHALRDLEKGSEVKLATRSQNRVYLPTALGRGPVGKSLAWWVHRDEDRAAVFRHRTWLRLIILAVGSTFAAGALWSLLSYPWM